MPVNVSIENEKFLAVRVRLNCVRCGNSKRRARERRGGKTLRFHWRTNRYKSTRDDQIMICSSAKRLFVIHMLLHARQTLNQIEGASGGGGSHLMRRPQCMDQITAHYLLDIQRE